MQVIPAVDLKGGKCGRLQQGRAEAETVYSDDPVGAARRWAAEGAPRLHVVDLDGAFQGRPVHTEIIRQIAAGVPIPIEVGGGLRTDADIEAVLHCGVERVVLGTRVWAELKELARLVKRFGERMVVGIDARDGRVQVRGWTETTEASALDLAREADRIGVRTLIYTDTAKDGMLAGPNVKAVAAICDAVKCEVISSGGISSPAHIRDLARLNRSNLVAVIVGKALYDGRTTYKELAEW